jgi:hypothetical protein
MESVTPVYIKRKSYRFRMNTDLKGASTPPANSMTLAVLRHHPVVLSHRQGCLNLEARSNRTGSTKSCWPYERLSFAPFAMVLSPTTWAMH